MKKRSCRRDIEEAKNHETAVKIRKLTDKQLVDYIEEKIEKAKSEGYKAGEEWGYEIGFAAGARETGKALEPVSKVNEFISKISESDIAGIGKVTIKKLKVFAMEKGYL